MSTSFIGDVSIIEVYDNVYSLYFMLEELQKKSRLITTLWLDELVSVGFKNLSKSTLGWTRD
jgi:hypothetical protein